MPRRNVSPYLWMIALPLGLIGGVLFINERHNATSRVNSPTKIPITGTPAAPAPEATTSPKPEPVSVSFMGTLFAHESVDIAAKIEGRLDEVSVELGDHIKPNAVIARLDPKPFQQELKVSEAGRHAAQAELRKAELELVDARERHARRLTLFENGVLSQEEMLTAKRQVEIIAANVDIAKARVGEREALMVQLQEKLTSSEIRSPYAGIVSARHRNPGAIITRGEPIVSITKSENLWVRFAVPSEQTSQLTIGSNVTLRLDNLDLTIPGTLENIAPMADAVLQMVMVEAKLQVPASAKKLLQPGLVGQVFLRESGVGSRE